MKSEKNSSRKKEEVAMQLDANDTNNNKDLPQRPIVKRRKKKVHDDGFEHRASAETV